MNNCTDYNQDFSISEPNLNTTAIQSSGSSISVINMSTMVDNILSKSDIKPLELNNKVASLTSAINKLPDFMKNHKTEKAKTSLIDGFINNIPKSLGVGFSVMAVALICTMVVASILGIIPVVIFPLAVFGLITTVPVIVPILVLIVSGILVTGAITAGSLGVLSGALTSLICTAESMLLKSNPSLAHRYPLRLEPYLGLLLEGFHMKNIHEQKRELSQACDTAHKTVENELSEMDKREDEDAEVVRSTLNEVLVQLKAIKTWTTIQDE